MVWESDYAGIDNFGWSSDMKNIYYTFVLHTFGIKKCIYPNFKEEHVYYGCGGPYFINFNNNNSLIVTSLENSQIWLLDNNIVSVSDPFFTEKYKIFPNPATDYIIFNSPFLMGQVGVSVEIFDVYGYRVKAEEIYPTDQSYRINISTLSTGIYFLKIGNEKPIKFVKM